MSPRPGKDSYLNAEDKISSIVEMTSACHSDQREESCIMTLGDNYFEERHQQERAFKNLPVNTTMMEY